MSVMRLIAPISAVLSVIVGLLSLFWVPQAYAWGDVGHEIICEIAFQELNPPARAEVARLIQLDSHFRTFSQSCIWPDHPRQRSAEHFINLPRSARGIGTAPCPTAATCTLTAIAQDLAVVSQTTAPDAAKLAALKFLGHWIGDIHQPLHVSFQDDKGGNEINERGPCTGDLHAVWDTCMITRQLGANIQTIVTDLRGQVTDAQRTQWTSTSPKDWANESFKITTSPDVEYCVQKNNACWYQRHNRAFNAGEVKKVVAVHEAYMDRHLPTIQLRLTQAGVRLGRLLNQALGGQ